MCGFIFVSLNITNSIFYCTKSVKKQMLNIQDKNSPHDEKQSPSANRTQSSLTEGKSNLQNTIRNLIFSFQQPFSFPAACSPSIFCSTAGRAAEACMLFFADLRGLIGNLMSTIQVPGCSFGLFGFIIAFLDFRETSTRNLVTLLYVRVIVSCMWNKENKDKAG